MRVWWAMALLLLLAGASAALNVNSSSWPQLHYDASRTSFNPNSTLPFSNESVWTYNTSGNAYNLLISDGRVFSKSVTSSTLYVLDESTGALLWSNATGAQVTHDISVANGKVFTELREDPYNKYVAFTFAGAEAWKTLFSETDGLDGLLFLSNNLYGRFSTTPSSDIRLIDSETGSVSGYGFQAGLTQTGYLVGSGSTAYGGYINNTWDGTLPCTTTPDAEGGCDSGYLTYSGSESKVEVYSYPNTARLVSYPFLGSGAIYSGLHVGENDYLIAIKEIGRAHV